MRNHLGRGIAALVLILGLVSCGGHSLPARPPLGLAMHIETGEFPGRSEQYVITKHGRTVCAAVDEDGDGELDHWSYHATGGNRLELLNASLEGRHDEFCMESLCVVIADHDENGLAEIIALARGHTALFEMWDGDQDGTYDWFECNEEDGSKWIETRDTNRDGAADYWFHRYGKDGALIAEDSDHDGVVESTELAEYREAY